MNLIKEIYEKDLLLDKTSKREVTYRVRKAARALIFNEQKIAVLNAKNLYFHKLPGGGIEGVESVVEGLAREILEETGCRIESLSELGVTIEYRDSIELLQISYVFEGSVVDSSGSPKFTKKEESEGFELVWLTTPEAINIMKNEKSSTYAGKFIQVRDLAILEYYSSSNRKM